MKIFLKTFGKLEELIPQREFSFPDEDLSIQGFFQLLVRQYGPELADHLFPEGAFYPHYALLVNGINIQNLRGTLTPLANGDQISVFTLVAGG
jgi:molybdopterin converting factor small subunit